MVRSTARVYFRQYAKLLFQNMPVLGSAAAWPVHDSSAMIRLLTHNV